MPLKTSQKFLQWADKIYQIINKPNRDTNYLVTFYSFLNSLYFYSGFPFRLYGDPEV